MPIPWQPVGVPSLRVMNGYWWQDTFTMRDLEQPPRRIRNGCLVMLKLIPDECALIRADFPLGVEGLWLNCKQTTRHTATRETNHQHKFREGLHSRTLWLHPCCNLSHLPLTGAQFGQVSRSLQRSSSVVSYILGKKQHSLKITNWLMGKMVAGQQIGSFTALPHSSSRDMQYVGKIKG